jgi:hypothetical protein
MWGTRTTNARLRSRLLSALALTAALGLSACGDVDNALFGDEGPGPVAANQYPPGGPPPQGVQPGAPGTLPGAPTTGGESTGPAPSIAITPIAIEPGSNTGTAVSATIATIRSQVAALEDHLAANAARLQDLRNQGADAAGSYHQAKAHITTRLQIGTTRGNPELVSEWNVAQSALDSLAGNINGLNALSTAVAGDSSAAHFALDQITATFNVSGAVDEDHRQLSVLEDETQQTIVVIDRLLRAATDDTQRQTAYVANERSNLTTLAGAIKNGELYGGDISGAAYPSGSAGGSYSGASFAGGAPLVTIRFDHPGVNYQQILYAALSQTLQTRPNAAFSVVAVSPTRGNATAVQLAQTAAKNHAADVMRTMTDMGVPATRLAVASQTDPSAASSEVRVFAR